MLTQFRRRKLDLYDVNKDGYLEAADYTRVGEEFATSTGSAPGSPDYEQLRAAYLEVWERLWQAADANQDGKVTRDEFLAYHEALPVMRETVAELARTILRLTDRDGDGKISLAEYAALSQAYGDDPNAPGNWLVGPL